MATPRTVAFHTLGCKLNYSETSSIRRTFESKGYTAVPFDQMADVYVINTCSVTDFADRKCRKSVRQARQRSPRARIVVTGCYAQLKPAEIAAIEGVDLVLGAAEKFRMLDYIDGLSQSDPDTKVQAGNIDTIDTFVGAFSFGDRTRSFLKVQDGCDYKCSFCTIPKARGGSRSDTIDNVVRNARKIAERGVREIVLTGVNIGDFGKSKSGGNECFLDLIRALDTVDGIDRFRISSIEPNLCSDAIIDFVASSQKFVPHFHMPLQSGSDRILRLMRRRYRRSLYAERVQQIKSLMPHACIGVDVIVGFPGESTQDFQVCYDFLDSLDISYLHVFTYSERPNTLATDMPGSVPMHHRRKRNALLRNLSQKKRQLFYASHLGSERPVLLESVYRPGWIKGFTDNYIQVIAPGEDRDLNHIQPLRLDSLDHEAMLVHGYTDRSEEYADRQSKNVHF